MKKMIIILFLMLSFFINVCIVNAETKEELEKKYEFFSKLVEQDIEFIKKKINLIKGEYTESEVLDKLIEEVTNSQKLGVADWARELALLSRPYNDAFWANKSCETTDNYNCSQLVWCAYNAITTINLDYNGGFGVYPNDITSSNNLTYATTY